MRTERVICYTCRFCKINCRGCVYCSLRKKGEQCINYDKWESWEDVLDKIRAEMKPYTDPKGFIVIGESRFNMILDRCKAESEPQESEG